MKLISTVRNLALMLCVVGLGAASACSPPDALPPPTPGPAATSAAPPATSIPSAATAATTTDCFRNSDGTLTSCTPCSYPGLNSLLPHETDSQLGVSATGSYGTNPSAPHCYANPASTSNNLLFLFLPGSFAVPTEYQMIAYQASALGYHVLSLSWANAATNGPARVDDPVNVPDLTEICKKQSLDCWSEVRMNRFNGTAETTPDGGTVAYTDPYVSPKPTVNSIEHRLTQALLKLGWTQFLTGTTGQQSPSWPSIVVAGHSQGGGMAAFIAHNLLVKGVVSFSEPNDATYVPLLGQSTCTVNPLQTTLPATWVLSSSKTPLNDYIGLLGCQDLTFTQTVTVWSMLGGGSGYVGPAGAAGVIIDPQGQAPVQPPYGASHRLLTNATASHANGAAILITDAQSASHDATVVDCRFPPGCSTVGCTPSPSAPPNCGCSATTSAPTPQCVPSPVQGDYATPLCTTPNKKLTNADGTPNPQLKPVWQQMLITAGGLDPQKWAPATTCDLDAKTP